MIWSEDSYLSSFIYLRIGVVARKRLKTSIVEKEHVSLIPSCYCLENLHTQAIPGNRPEIANDVCC